MYELPIFPLNTVLFPGMPLRLHVFEERYKLMMKHIFETNRTFGVCLIKNGLEAYGPLATPYLTGCTARVTHVEPLPDGRFDLTAVGDERFQIVQTSYDQPYLNAFVEGAPLKSHHSIEVMRGMSSLRQRVSKYLAILSRTAEADPEGGEGLIDLDFDLNLLQLPEDPMMLIYLSAALLQISPYEKQPLLESETAAHMLRRLQLIYRRELAILPGLLEVPSTQAGAAALWN